MEFDEFYKNVPNSQSGWGDSESDPIRDLEEMFIKIQNEKWICKNCAWYTTVPPNRGIRVMFIKCPECGGEDFHYSTKPLEEL